MPNWVTVILGVTLLGLLLEAVPSLKMASRSIGPHPLRWAGVASVERRSLPGVIASEAKTGARLHVSINGVSACAYRTGRPSQPRHPFKSAECLIERWQLSGKLHPFRGVIQKSA